MTGVNVDVAVSGEIHRHPIRPFAQIQQANHLRDIDIGPLRRGQSAKIRDNCIVVFDASKTHGG